MYLYQNVKAVCFRKRDTVRISKEDFLNRYITVPGVITIGIQLHFRLTVLLIFIKY